MHGEASTYRDRDTRRRQADAAGQATDGTGRTADGGAGQSPSGAVPSPTPGTGDAPAWTPTRAAATIDRLVDALDGVLSCSREVIELAVLTFVAGGHLLLEDVPGVGKTTLARALGIAIGGASRRIQFTPDLLPSDLTGVSIYTQSTGRFDFHEGPLFANVVIADEVNRANPKAQSAMLEAMGEGSVSVDGDTHRLPEPYFVAATQNPIELEGTYPLPEAQLDRFMTCTSFGYPSAAAESAMIASDLATRPLEGLGQVCPLDETVRLRAMASTARLSQPVADYIVTLSAATRAMDGVRFGVSPRGSLHLAAMARAHALAAGRGYVIPEDAQTLAVPVLAHRIVLDDAGHGAGMLRQARRVIAGLVEDTPVPRADAVRPSARR